MKVGVNEISDLGWVLRKKKKSVGMSQVRSFIEVRQVQESYKEVQVRKNSNRCLETWEMIVEYLSDIADIKIQVEVKLLIC